MISRLGGLFSVFKSPIIRSGGGGGGGEVGNFLIKEDASFFLLEDGVSKILLEI